MLFLYNLLLFLLFIPAAFFLLLSTKIKAGSFFAQIKERFCAPNFNLTQGKEVLWVHCSSLGEVRAVEPLLKSLNNYSIHLTTLTISGKNYALDNSICSSISLAPADFTFVANNFVKKLKPSALIIVETELWPGIIFAAKKIGARVLLVNARLSEKSFPIYSKTAFFWRKVLEKIDFLQARYPSDGERFISLGVPREKTSISGNIKYDRDFSIFSLKKEELGFNAQDVVLVAGSVRDGEEEIFLNAWLAALKENNNLKLVFAPRHLENLNTIYELLNKNSLSFIKYSNVNFTQATPYPVIVLDKFGELQKLYSIADLAFVGGSLIKKGGQNPIEPAAYGVAVLFGEFMENFLPEANLLIDAGGALRVRGSLELTKIIVELSLNLQLRKKMGQLAHDVVNLQRGALNKAVELIKLATKSK